MAALMVKTPAMQVTPVQTGMLPAIARSPQGIRVMSLPSRPPAPGVTKAEGGAMLAKDAGLSDAEKGLLIGGLAIGGVLLVGLLGAQMYAGQKLGRKLHKYPGDKGSAWGWFWAGLGGPVGAGLLAYKRAPGDSYSERMEFLKGSLDL